MSGRKIVILLGAPGAGKGTQARSVMQKLSIPQISTGDMLRDAIARKTPLGLAAKQKMEAGELVSDDIVNGIVADRIQRDDCRKGFILDGYPRTVAQAERFRGEMINGDQLFVIEIAVDTARLAARLTGRWICSSCGEIYNVHGQAPKQEGICDRCGNRLVHRSDDQEHLIGERLRAYQAETYPLTEYYRKAGFYHRVNGSQPVHQITDEILSLIESHEGRNTKFA